MTFVCSTPHDVYEFLHRGCRAMKSRSLVGRQVDLNYLLDASFAEFHRHSDKQPVDAVLAFKKSRARKNLLLVFENRFYHLNCGGRWSVVRRTRLEETNDFRAAVRGARYYLIDLFSWQQVRERNSRDRRVARQRDHRVSVSAQHKRGHVFDRHVQGFGYEAAHSSRVQHSGHSDHSLFWQTGMLHRDVAHRFM